MKILPWNNKGDTKTSNKKKIGSFRALNKSEKEKFLKRGASDFSKKFTKVIVKLANE